MNFYMFKVISCTIAIAGQSLLNVTASRAIQSVALKAMRLVAVVGDDTQQDHLAPTHYATHSLIQSASNSVIERRVIVVKRRFEKCLISVRSGPWIEEVAASNCRPQYPRKNEAALTLNGMVRPCSCPACKLHWPRGAKDKEHAMYQKLKTAIAVVGIDIGKTARGTRSFWI